MAAARRCSFCVYICTTACIEEATSKIFKEGEGEEEEEGVAVKVAIAVKKIILRRLIRHDTLPHFPSIQGYK